MHAHTDNIKLLATLKTVTTQGKCASDPVTNGATVVLMIASSWDDINIVHFIMIPTRS
jgi:hypothetical protein